MITRLKTIYNRQLFFPSWLGIFTNPFFLSRRGLQKAIAQFSLALNGRLLDVGCGTKPYQELFDVDIYVGLDINNESSKTLGMADYLYDGTTFPHQNEEFDSVLCNQVLEHVFNPVEFICEIRRVLKPKGRLLLTVPFVWEEHEQPFDYARYSSFGLQELLKAQGFKIIEQQKIGTAVSTIFQLINAYLYKITLRLPKFLNILLTATILACFNLMALCLSLLLPENPDLFLDQIILAEKTN